MMTVAQLIQVLSRAKGDAPVEIVTATVTARPLESVLLNSDGSVTLGARGHADPAGGTNAG